MYREGHVGVALAAYTPLGAAATAVGYGGLGLLGAAVTVALASLPDQDVRLPVVSHRGITHTVWFAFAIGGVSAAVGWATGDALGPRRLVAGFAGVVGWVTVVAHVACDALTPMGVTPWHPLSGRHYTAALVTADNTLANYLLLATGVGVAAAGLLLAASF